MQRRCTTLICNARVGHDQVGQGSSGKQNHAGHTLSALF